MKKKIRDLTIEELLKLRKCFNCSECPFGDYENNSLSDKLCDLLTTEHSDNPTLDLEVDIQDEK